MCEQIRRHNGFVLTLSVVALHRVLAEITEQAKGDVQATADADSNAAYNVDQRRKPRPHPVGTSRDVRLRAISRWWSNLPANVAATLSGANSSVRFREGGLPVGEAPIAEHLREHAATLGIHEAQN